MFFVYVLFNNEKNKIYIGQTNNIEKRLQHHNGLLLSKPTSYTRRQGGTWVLIYSEEIGTRQEARIREKQLKSQKGRTCIWSKIRI